MNESKPASITAAQWHTIADDVKAGRVEARYGQYRVLEYKQREDDINAVWFEGELIKNRSALYLDDDAELALTWHDSEPAPLDALFETITDACKVQCEDCEGTGLIGNSTCKPCEGSGRAPSYDAQAALATLRQQVAQVQTERDALRKGLNEVKDELNRLYEEATNGRQNQNAPGAFEYAGLEGFVRQILNGSKQS